MFCADPFEDRLPPVIAAAKAASSLRKSASEIERAGSRLLLAPETDSAAEDALKHGWLASGVLEEIRTEKASEEPAGALEEALNQQT